jgi:hypothetical protein
MRLDLAWYEPLRERDFLGESGHWSAQPHAVTRRAMTRA